LHHDNQTIVKERIYLDKTDFDVLHDEITVVDHALTRPWTVTRNYRREPDRFPVWREVVCSESNQHVRVGKDDYFLSADARQEGSAPAGLAIFQSISELTLALPARPRR
jgi:hypothetical protein